MSTKPIIILTLVFIHNTNAVDTGKTTGKFPGFTANLTIRPPEIDELYQNTRVDVFVNITFPASNNTTGFLKGILEFLSDDPSVAIVENGTFTIPTTAFEDGASPNLYLIIQVRGVFLGRTKVVARLTLVDQKGNLVNVDTKPAEFPVAVWRPGSKTQIYFAGVATVLQVITTFMMGTQVDWRVIVAVLKKPIAPIIGFCCQYLIMPLLAFGWSLLLLPGQPYLQLGFFAVGCCPGGKSSNFWSILLDANLDLSVTLTVVSSVASIAMMPLWLLTLGTMVISKGTSVQLPFLNLVGSLALLMIPIAFGMILVHFKPTIAKFVEKIIKPVTIVLVIVLVSMGLSLQYYIFSLFTWRKVVCGLLLPWCGFALAALVAWVFRQNLRDVKTIAIETGIQNASVAIIIISTSLPHPDSDLVVVMPFICLMFTPLPLLLGFIYLNMRKLLDRWQTKQKTSDVPTEKEADIDLKPSAGKSLEGSDGQTKSAEGVNDK
jgi:sodium/bile acid cotransporter 3/5